MKKVISMFVALTIALNLSTPALALPGEAWALSEHAGGSVSCEIFVADGDRVTSRLLEVPIPAGTRKADEVEIVRAAVLKVENIRMPRVNDIFTVLSKETSIPTILDTEFSAPWRLVGGGKLTEDSNSLLVEFTGMQYGGGVSKMYIRLISQKQAKTWTNEISPATTDYTYFLKRNGIELKSEDQIEVRAATDAGYVNVSSCTVRYTYQAM
ncbi:MAG: hypothetical protein HFF07_03380 [Oscillospiraceae bacterium]|nr:hypothetical protein [Oscillospiraceae bacterium]